jgi:hypothetical protein
MKGSRIVKQHLKPWYSYRVTENKGNRENINRKKNKQEQKRRNKENNKKKQKPHVLQHPLPAAPALPPPGNAGHERGADGAPVVVGG